MPNQTRAKIVIKLKSPDKAIKLKNQSGYSRARNSSYAIFLLNKKGKYERLPILNEIFYRLTHMRYKDELSFDINKLGSTTFVYVIDDKKGWTFADNPFCFSKGQHHVETGSIKLSDGNKKATMIINGSSTPDDQEIIYAIRYKDKKGITHTHDPIVRNGQSLPLVGENILANKAIEYPSLNEVFENVNLSDKEFLNEFIEELKLAHKQWDKSTDS